MPDTSGLTPQRMLSGMSNIVDLKTRDPVVTPQALMEELCRLGWIDDADAAVVFLRRDGDWELSTTSKCDLGELTWLHRVFGLSLDRWIMGRG
jgi:hypothetical protein